MALKILQPGIQPLGQFDGLDTVYTTVRGGEVGTLTYVATPGTDLHTPDVDGYVATTRPAVTTALTAGDRPLFLIDDGTSGYGTLFGEVVGAVAGQVVTGGAALGPHTATGSGKLTLWDKPGLYSVTLDAVDETAVTGLHPQNPTLAGGDALFATATGLLTPDAASAFDGGALTIARFIEFTTNGSLVNTPVTLVSALNSPSGQAAVAVTYTEAVIHFHCEG